MNTADPAPRTFAGPALVLASASRTRADMLRRAGVNCHIDPAHIDEEEIKQAMRASGASATELAETLADRKAHKIAARHPGALVVGADQVLDCQGVWFDKPVDRAAARAQLLSLRGREHELISGVCVLRNGERLWHHVGRAHLTVRPFSDAFLDGYLDQAGSAVRQSVGAYQIEGLGAQLFSRVEGDYFTILGLPLLPLLDFLRDQGVVKS